MSDICGIICTSKFRKSALLICTFPNQCLSHKRFRYMHRKEQSSFILSASQKCWSHSMIIMLRVFNCIIILRSIFSPVMIFSSVWTISTGTVILASPHLLTGCSYLFGCDFGGLCMHCPAPPFLLHSGKFFSCNERSASPLNYQKLRISLLCAGVQF